jgi:hypothetical protein
MSSHCYCPKRGTLFWGSGAGGKGSGPGPGIGPGSGGVGPGINPSKWNMSVKVIEPPAGNICDEGETPISEDCGGPPALYWML